MSRWLLPDQVADLLPREAETIEFLRREFLSLFHTWGYELFASPLIEYLDALLVGAGQELEAQTFKLIDHRSGRLLGLRPDITPQMARIDAHLNISGIMRFAYAGSVLRSQPSGPFEEKEFYQVGAELFGYAGLASDCEVVRLLRDALSLAGCERIHFDFGHVGLVRSILEKGAFSGRALQDILEALNAKDRKRLLPHLGSLDSRWQKAFCSLLDINGGIEVLEEASAILPADDSMIKPLSDLQAIVAVLKDSGFSVGVDLANIEGYSYHTGIIFSVYSCGKPLTLARGGRYDGIGAAFGVSRPATGFSIDLKALASLMQPVPAPEVILAPYRPDDNTLQEKIHAMRRQGFIVIQEFPESEIGGIHRQMTKALRQMNNQWQVVSTQDGTTV